MDISSDVAPDEAETLAAFRADFWVAPAPEFMEAPQVLTQADCDEGVRIAQKLEREHPQAKPYDAIKVSRETGAIVAVVEAQRTVVHMPERRETVARPRESRPRRVRLSKRSRGDPSRSADEPGRPPLAAREYGGAS